MSDIRKKGVKKPENREENKTQTPLSEKIAPEPEIRRHLSPDGELLITDPQPGYAYRWAYSGGGGNNIRRRQTQGWEMVVGNMPEAHEFAEARDGTGVVGPRRVADVVLMRCKTEVMVENMRRNQQKQRAMEQGVTGELQDMAGSFRGKGLSVRVHSGEADPRELILGSRSGSAKQALDVGSAYNKLDGHLRRGDVPGSEIGR